MFKIDINDLEKVFIEHIKKKYSYITWRNSHTFSYLCADITERYEYMIPKYIYDSFIRGEKLGKLLDDGSECKNLTSYIVETEGENYYFNDLPDDIVKAVNDMGHSPNFKMGDVQVISKLATFDRNELSVKLGGYDEMDYEEILSNLISQFDKLIVDILMNKFPAKVVTVDKLMVECHMSYNKYLRDIHRSPHSYLASINPNHVILLCGDLAYNILCDMSNEYGNYITKNIKHLTSLDVDEIVITSEDLIVASMFEGNMYHMMCADFSGDVITYIANICNISDGLEPRRLRVKV